MAPRLLEPTTPSQAAEMLADAAKQGIALAVRGAGTKHSPTAFSGAASLSTRGLAEGLRHDAGDLVATIPAGLRLAEANRVLGLARQWLPLDPPHAGRATIGGIIAANDSGPRRHKFGAPRDLIIGVELALTDGRVAKSGGRVVKNVAGYDLARLMCGSHGSLAVITSATFRLAPLTPASRTLIAHLPDAQTAANLALAVNAAPVTPSAIEIEAPSARLLVRFESTARAADGMADAVRLLLVNGGATVATVEGDAEHQAWEAHEALTWHQPGVVAKLSILPTDVSALCAELEQTASGLSWSLSGRAALGVLLLHVGGYSQSAAAALQHIREVVERRGGSFVLVGTPAELPNHLKSPTASGPLADLMRAVKARFDPRGVLGPLPG